MRDAMALFHQRHRRVLALAATFLFLLSVYLSVTRLFNTSYARESLAGTSPPPPGPAAAAAAAPRPPSPTLDLTPGPADLSMSYGEFGRPPLEGLTLLSSLPQHLVPTDDNGRRLVIVGDIHGMADDLDRLLLQIGFDSAWDHLITVGDMVHGGPQSRRVVDRLMALNASAIRGHVEDRILLAHAEAQAAGGLSADISTPDSELRRGVSGYLDVARALSPPNLDWLSRLPVILSVESLALYVVHAGLVPGVPPEKQDPWAAMHIRTLIYPRIELRRDKKKLVHRAPADDLEFDLPDSDNATATPLSDATVAASPSPPPPPPPRLLDPDHAVAVPVDDDGGETWVEVWNRLQHRLPAPKRRTVVYGHDEIRGLVQGEHTAGLDSNCVGGGSLTAMIIQTDGAGHFRHSISQVICQP